MQHLFWDVVEVADVMELFHLVPDRRCEVGICVSESAGRDSCHKVEVLLRSKVQGIMQIGKTNE